MECPHCGKKLSVLRKLQKDEFCSAAHRKAYAKKQNDDALDFLLQSKPRLRPPVQAVDAASPAAQAVEPKPLLVLAPFAAERVAPELASARLVRDAQPVKQKRPAILPDGARAAKPRLLRSPGASPAIVASTSALHGPGLPPKGPAAFTAGHPRGRVSVVQPIWIAPLGPVTATRSRAGFVTMAPAFIELAAHPLRAGATGKFGIRFATAQAHSAPPRAALRLAPARRLYPETSRSPGRAIERKGSARRLRTASPAMQIAITAPRASLPRLCGRIAVPPPAAVPAPPCEAATIASGPMDAPERQPAHGLHTVPRTLSLMPASRAHLDPPPPAAPVSAAIATMRAPLIFSTAMGLGRFARLSPIFPSFDTPRVAIPNLSIVPEPRPRVSQRLAGYWRSAPLWSHRVTVAMPLIAALLVGASRLQTSAGMREAQAAMTASISRRALIDIRDDFRSGLSRWTGAPGWAGSWSYDAAGFARPGRLALLSGSLPLNDYRLEFFAQIEKKALGWVYRAADTRNYYAMKLVASERGPAAVYAIVRYAMIDGHQRMKIQLPLPMAAGSAKTMLRVRQEIRDTQFTTYLDGRLVDTWSDATLTRGGIGFFADPGESAYIRWVDVAHNDDALGRICSYIAGRNPD